MLLIILIFKILKCYVTQDIIGFAKYEMNQKSIVMRCRLQICTSQRSPRVIEAGSATVGSLAFGFFSKKTDAKPLLQEGVYIFMFCFCSCFFDL